MSGEFRKVPESSGDYRSVPAFGSGTLRNQLRNTPVPHPNDHFSEICASLRLTRPKFAEKFLWARATSFAFDLIGLSCCVWNHNLHHDSIDTGSRARARGQ